MRIAATRGAALRRIAGPAAEGLRADRWTLALVAVAAIAGLLAYVPASTLYRAAARGVGVLRLAYTPVPVTDIRWTTAVRGGGVTQQAAIDDLLLILYMAAIGALAVSVLAIVSVSAARAWRRARELVVRRAVGASRRNLLLSALAEALGVVLVAGGVGVLLAGGAMRVGVALWPGIAEGWRLAPVGALSVIGMTILLAAIAPVGAAASRRLIDTDERAIPGFIPAVQLGLSLALLAASVAVLRRPIPGGQASTVGDENGVVYALDAGTLPIDQRASTFASLVSKLESTAGVVAVSLTSPRQPVGLGTVDFVKTDCGICPVGGILLPWRELYAAHFFVSGDTFRTQGARIVTGRGFTAGDSASAAPVAVVNRYLAARYFQNGEAVGRDISVGSGIRSQVHRVIGIVDDRRPAAFGGAAQPLEAVYLSVLQHPVAAADLVVRTAPGTGMAARVSAMVGAWPGIRGSVAGREPELRRREAVPTRWFGGALALEAIAIFGVAIVGTFTAMALWVRALRHELALRRAVGATRARVMAWVLARAAGVGIRGAVVGAVFFAPVVLPELERLMPGVRVWDAATFASLAGLLAVTALCGAMLPARRAVRRPPAAGLASR